MPARYQPRRGWLPASSGAAMAAIGSSVAGATWSQVIASTSEAVYVVAVQCGNSTAPVTLDIGTGGGGAEVVASSYIVGGYSGSWASLPFPVRIPASTRVSMRHSGTTTTDGLLWVPESKFSPRPYQIPGASATAVASASSSGTSWVQAIASTTAAAYLVTAYAESGVGTPGVVDIGTGGAGAEVSVVQAPMSYMIGSTVQYINATMPPTRIPGGTRIAIRAPSSNFKVGFTLVYESAVIW